jgi:hypothetical protein
MVGMFPRKPFASMSMDRADGGHFAVVYCNEVSANGRTGKNVVLVPLTTVATFSTQFQKSIKSALAIAVPTVL